MKYRERVESISLSEAAKKRLLARMEGALREENRIRFPAWKGALAAGATLALACAVAIPVWLSLSGERETGGVQDMIGAFGGGALGNNMVSEGDPQAFTPLYCGYLFAGDVFEKSEVKATLLFGVDEAEFSAAAERDLSEHGEMVEFSLVAGVYNYELRGNDEFYGAAVGGYESGAQIYYAETVTDLSEIDLSVFAVDLEAKETDERPVCGNTAYSVSYAHRQEVTVPAELFAGEKGRVDFFFYGYIKYADGTEVFYPHAYNEGPPCFFYTAEGDKVRLSAKG